MAVIKYKGVTLPHAHIRPYAYPPTAWQIDAFPAANGEIAQELGKRGADINIEGILRDASGATYLPSIAMLAALDDGTSGTLDVPGFPSISNVIVLGGVDVLERQVYPDPSNNSLTLQAIRYSIRLHRLI